MCEMRIGLRMIISKRKKKTLERKKKYFWEFEPIILNVAVMLAEKDS